MALSLPFFFCFIVNVIGAFFNESLLGTPNDNRIYFFQDTVNIILYLFICPSYVGLSCWLIVSVIKGWNEINSYALELGNTKSKEIRKIPYKAPLLATLIFGIAFFSTSNYISDIMTEMNNTNKYYWFVGFSDTGEAYTGPLWVYYFLLNFTLLLITLLSITFFMSIFSVVIDVGNSLDKTPPNNKLEFLILRTKLSSFTEAYMLAKLLTGLYMINVFLWEKTALGKTDNLIIAALFISLIGVFFVSIPRYFLELQWHKYKYRSGEVDEKSESYDDIRPFEIKLIATVLDTFLIGSFILTFFWPRIKESLFQ